MTDVPAFILLSNSDDVCLVDWEDYELLSRFAWTKHGMGYAVSSFWGSGYQCTMHRVIMLPDPGLVVHHRNHDRLDNRRENLTVTTTTENGRMKKLSVDRGYQGVYFSMGTWAAYKMAAGVRRYLGRFRTREEALDAYENA